MGWSFDTKDIGRKAFIERICSGFSPSYTPLAHRVVGNHVWHLLRIEETGRKMVALTLIAKDRHGGWGDKGTSEDAGPYTYDCPLSLLEQASPPPVGSYAADWREKVRQYHADKAERKALPVGAVVEFGDHQYRLGESAGPRRGRIATRISDGLRFRLKARHLSAAELCPSINQTA